MPSTETDSRLEAARDVLAAHPEWYHSIQLANGLETPGRMPASAWNEELRALQLPQLRDKRVLDIGAYDGFFSFAAERLGAKAVVALDHYVWSTDMVGYMAAFRAARARGEHLPSPHLTPFWQPDTLPGRRPFDAARECLRSQVQPVVGDFLLPETTHVGQFDVVFFLGVLYHLEEPLRAVRRVFDYTAPGGVAVIETEGIVIPNIGDRAMWEFFPADELNGDASNWWAPNHAGLAGACRAAGFSRIDIQPDRRSVSRVRRVGKQALRVAMHTPFVHVPYRTRIIVHAWRDV